MTRFALVLAMALGALAVLFAVLVVLDPAFMLVSAGLLTAMWLLLTKE